MNISNHKVWLNCPNCNFAISAYLEEVKKNEIIFCPGCLFQITLINEDNSIKKAEKMIYDFQNSLKEIFKR